MDMPMPPALPAQPRYAGFWIRLLAYIIDAIILGALTFPLARVLSMMGIGEQSSNVMSINPMPNHPSVALLAILL